MQSRFFSAFLLLFSAILDVRYAYVFSGGRKPDVFFSDFAVRGKLWLISWNRCNGSVVSASRAFLKVRIVGI